MSAAATRTLLEKLLAVEATVKSGLIAVIDGVRRVVETPEATAATITALRVALRNALDDIDEVGSMGLLRVAEENEIALRRSITSVMNEMGVEELSARVFETKAPRTSDGLEAWRDGLETLVSMVEGAAVEQQQKSRLLDPQPEVGLSARLFSRQPARLRGRMGLGVLPSVPGQLMGWWVKIAYEMVNAERDSAYLAMVEVLRAAEA